MLIRRFRAVIPLVVLVLLQGCGNMLQAKDAGMAAIAKFHSELDAGTFDAIWGDTDDAFRKATQREQFQKIVDAIHRKLGRVKQSLTVNFSVRNLNMRTVVVLVQKTQFEHGSATETFTYAAHDQAVKLLGYNIQSVDLMTL